ncbi:hypothetical protein PHYPSEUDO_014924 [Phytophthora pseudosyringae]|uniref:BED-type domain-containing protein n=1 Tax=Phytophthora pseudosyringae TaxID=221518 RepID=A0A8T1W440_9STRA|nr:hypothetical protein PHYPSEUDO_014924 [Phytophthora pseudosyringae]
MASSSSTSTPGLYASSSAEQDVDMTLSLQAAIEASKDDEDEALSLLSSTEHPPRELLAPPTSSAASTSTSTASRNGSSNSRPATSVVGGKVKASGSSNVSAVYRWYEVEESFSAKKREESSIAKCKLCRQQGKLERKTCVRFSKSVTSNLWRHLKENHPDVYEKHRGEKKSVQMHRVMGVKKRGRKKKKPPPTPPATATPDAMAVSIGFDVGAAPKLQTPAGNGSGQSAFAVRPPTKKAKREERHTHVYSDYPLAVVSSALHRQHQGAGRQTAPPAAGASAAIVSGAALARNFNPEKVREAMGYLCLYEMLPFELCSSHAFRNLMVECSGGAGGYVNDSNSYALFAKEIAFEYAKKMAAEVKVRTVMQMKAMDFSHLMLSEWRSSNYLGGNDATVAPPTSFTSPPSDNESGFLALFAVGLDQEFNPFRRCLHVSSIGSYRAGYGNSITVKLAGDKELKKAMDRVAPCRFMPEILAVEPPCSEYQSFCKDHKLHFLESVPTVLQNIMIATINGIQISGSYCLGSEVLTNSDAGFRNRRLDKGEYIETSSTAVAPDSSSDAFYGISAVEIASSILEELPTNLTGHTYRDLINKYERNFV